MISEYHIRSVLERLNTRLEGLFEESILCNSVSGEKQLVSLSIIGRPISQRRIDTVMDIDTLVIVNGPMTKNLYHCVSSIFAELCNMSDTDVGISYQIADGPVKPLPQTRINLFFHVLLHTVDSYKSSPLKLVKTSWQSEARTLLGIPVYQIQTYFTLSLTDIIRGPLGIRHCCDLIESTGSAYLIWQKAENERLDLSFSPVFFSERCEVVEICFYGVLRGASNALRWWFNSPKSFGIDLSDMITFSDFFFDFQSKNLPMKMWKKKSALRMGSWYPSVTETSRIVCQSLVFLRNLEIFIMEFERRRVNTNRDQIKGSIYSAKCHLIQSRQCQ
ncbi:MAG: hypothetical protein K8S62_15730 [Candidatus Sabulitectum sp.]|nr:hypothetical protein [Candidatus Sabulitectum sp.]